MTKELLSQTLCLSVTDIDRLISCGALPQPQSFVMEHWSPADLMRFQLQKANDLEFAAKVAEALVDSRDHA